MEWRSVPLAEFEWAGTADEKIVAAPTGTVLRIVSQALALILDVLPTIS